MRYNDLVFELHGVVAGAEAMNREEVRIERALALFPNGRTLSVLRGMKTAGARGDYETCRLNGFAFRPLKHATVECVQTEMDAVAALPPV